MDNTAVSNNGSNGSFFKKITYTDGIYPLLETGYIQNPNRIFAIPLLGLLIKVIALIPVFIEMFFLSLWAYIAVWLINPWVVLITGRYWQHAYQLMLGLFRLSAKVSFFLNGLTDKYPGFDFSTGDRFTFDIPMPENPKKLYAIPILGGFLRFIFLIPYLLYSSVISNAAGIGVMLLAWATVLFKGRYPEGIFELARDSIRVASASGIYLSGLSDKYPSFYISMAHDKIKIILIAVVLIFGVFGGVRFTSGGSSELEDRKEGQQDYATENTKPSLRTD